MRFISSFIAVCFLVLSPVDGVAKALKVVSLAPSWSHTVADIGAIDTLVGVTRYARFPAAIPQRVKANQIAVVGGFTDINLETILAVSPDLVLTSTSLQLGLKAQLEQHGIKVIHMSGNSLDEVYHKIIQLGEAIAHQQQATALVHNIQSALAQIKQQYAHLPKPKVYYEINYFYKCVPGQDSYITELIELTGATAIFSNREGSAPAVSWDEVVQANPDIVLLPTWPNAKGPSFSGPQAGSGTTTIDEVKQRPNATLVDAVKQDKVMFIDSAITKQPGPSIPDAARILAKAIYGQ
ncbi:ABC transporter substrate-binding protein [Shewanella intestini]|uniref:ABC transporter substrate-binding protein n=1 Tax=Shewanella intestini TaxID=2017544 RepID=A0ABS5I1N3_9GAMM|nr:MULTISPECIES: helical backbone metal receptor [Shewanella]MBR9727935.1 ABC transporter substrate-binding protein [Shewanella intestini]MRG36514.1 ABC transporter substrate-binding protein [Shewanella sp. XMDDZSB0408]